MLVFFILWKCPYQFRYKDRQWRSTVYRSDVVWGPTPAFLTPLILAQKLAGWVSPENSKVLDFESPQNGSIPKNVSLSLWNISLAPVAFNLHHHLLLLIFITMIDAQSAIVDAQCHVSDATITATSPSPLVCCRPIVTHVPPSHLSSG